MASPDKDGKKEAAVKAAGAAVVAGVVWSIISILKGKKEEVKESGLSVILDGGDKEEEEGSISPTNYTEEADYYNEKAIKASVEKIKASVEKIKDGGSIDAGVVYVEQEVIAILDVAKKLEDNAVDEKATEEKKKPWFRSLVDGLGDEKKKSLLGIFKDKANSNPGPEAKPSSNGNHHDIKKGDTLWAISGKYGISLETLKAANDLNDDKIYAGEKLVIPVPE